MFIAFVILLLSKLKMTKKEAYMHLENNKNISSQYKLYISKVVELLSPNLNAEKDIDEIFILEERLAKVEK